MEIELMEKRFRERSDRSGGGPVATEEIDIRIADEARQFFDDSAKTLEAVVPQLQEGDQGREMVETTGEIRKKIDQFFSDSTESQPAETTPQRRGTRPPPPPAAPGAPAAAQMDLKTALEKLRRHGVSKNAGPAPRPPAPAPEAAPSPFAPAPRAASTASPPAAATAGAAPQAAAGDVTGALPPVDTSAPDPAAVARPREAVDLIRQLSSLPPLDSDESGRPAEPPPTLRAARPADRPTAPASAAFAETAAPAAAERPAARPAPAPETPREPTPDVAAGGEFDSIFSAVEGIVLDTLKSSMNETMSAARKSEPELASVAVPTAEPMAEQPEPVPQDISDTVSQSISQSLPAPREDDEDDDIDRDVPAAAPYDWGVAPAPKPKGAWLLDTPEGDGEETATTEPEAERQEPAAPEAPSTGGPRAFLIRKASDEVRKFQTVVDALAKANVIDPESAAPAPAAPAQGEDDDSVSLDSFHDDRPSPEEIEQELSPMRLVEEIRRLRRLTQALVEKGVISATDLDKSQAV